MEYSVADYGSMIRDAVRTDAYAAALESVVVPDSVVVDIGTGTGLAALIACRLGARRVFAIEPSPVIDLTRQIARDNGFADRIEFFQESSLQVELPEPADVVVADLRGVLPLLGIHLPVLEDARRRFLKPDGVLIPQQDVIWCAPVQARKDIDEKLEVWRAHGRGFEHEAARTLMANNWWKTTDIGADDLHAEPQVVATLTYAAGVAADVSSSLSFTARRPGSLHGLCLWFDAELVDGIGFSNAPGAPEVIYGRAFFPLPEEVAITAGERIDVEVAANLVGGDYVFRWNVTVGSPLPRARFRQSTIASSLLTSHALHTGSEAHAPVLTDEGRRVLRALELMDGRRTVGEIAALLETQAGSSEDALALATRLSQKYSA